MFLLFKVKSILYYIIFITIECFKQKKVDTEIILLQPRAGIVPDEELTG